MDRPGVTAMEVPDLERLSDSDLEAFERKTRQELDALRKEQAAREALRRATAREEVRVEVARKLNAALADAGLWRLILNVGCVGFEVVKSDDGGGALPTVRLIGKIETGANHSGMPGRGRSAYTRLAPGLRLPQERYEEPILRVIEGLGREASHGQFLPLVRERLKGEMNDLDLAPLATGGPRWEKTARWAVGSLLQKGEVERTRRGHYRITERGRRRLRRAEG
jgi:hypothetical protein